MDTKIIEISGKKIIVGLEGDTIHAEFYTAEPTPPPPGAKTPPAGMKDKIQLSDWLQAQGYERGSAEYNQQLAAYGKDLPLEYNDHVPLR